MRYLVQLSGAILNSINKLFNIIKKPLGVLAIKRDIKTTKPLDNQLVIEHLYIAQILAKKYFGKGVEYDDLYQTACLGLLKAANSYDSSKGAAFPTYAAITAEGEVKRYFRDKAYLIRKSRKQNTLPYSFVSLSDEDKVSIDDYYPVYETGYARAEEYEFLDKLFATLESSEVEFVVLRYILGKTQKQIAALWGATVMKVCRFEKSLKQKLIIYNTNFA